MAGLSLSSDAFAAQVLEDAPFARALLGKTLPTLDATIGMCVLTSKASLVDDPFLLGKPTDVQTAVDLLDSLLKRASMVEDTFKIPSLVAAPKKQNLCVKWLHEHALSAAAARASGGGSGGGGGATEGSAFPASHAALLDAAAPPTSQADIKIAEELAASRVRREAHVGDATSMAALAALEEVLVSDATSSTKLRAYAKTLNASETVAHLLYAAHVREPKQGALSMPNALATRHEVERMRSVRAGVFAAARDRLVHMLPENADADVLIAAIFHGELAAKEGAKFTLRSLANPKQPPSWTGLASEANDSADSSKGQVSALIALQSVMRPIIFAFTVLHPLDFMAHDTFAIVMAEVSKGLKRNGVASAVDRVLSPLFREYELAWTQFQKSARVAMPTLDVVWAKVRIMPSVAGYLAQSAMPPPAAAPATEDAKAAKTVKQHGDKIQELMREIAALKRQRPGSPRPGSPTASERAGEGGFEVTGLGPKPDGAGEHWEKHRKKKMIELFKAEKPLPEGVSVKRKG